MLDKKQDVETTDAAQLERNMLISKQFLNALDEVSKPLRHLDEMNKLTENVENSIKVAKEDAFRAQEAFDDVHEEVRHAQDALKSTLGKIERRIKELTGEKGDRKRIKEIMAMIEESAGEIHNRKKKKYEAKKEANVELQNLTDHQMQESSQTVKLEEVHFVVQHWLEIVKMHLNQLPEHPAVEAPSDVQDQLHCYWDNLKRAKDAIDGIESGTNSYITQQLIMRIRSDMSSLREILRNWHKQEDPPAINTHPNREAIYTPIRWMIRRDMPEVLAIESASFEYPWIQEDFLHVLRQRNCIGMVSEYDQEIVGFMIYELHKNLIKIVNFAVDPHMRFRGVGTAMINKLVNKLNQQRRNYIQTTIRETNLPAQQFFKNNDFYATKVEKGIFEDTDEDAYHMEYRLQGKSQEEMKQKNRASRMGERT